MLSDHSESTVKIEKARERVIDSISNNIDLYGVTPSIGRLYATMYFQQHPMTLDEMSKQLGMSKTSMSTSVRTLLGLKMVKKVWIKGVRKDLYQVEEDWYQNFIDFFSMKWRKNLELNVKAAHQSKQELQQLLERMDLTSEDRKVAEHDLERMDYALDYYAWLEDIVHCFENKEIFKWLPKKQRKQVD